MRLAESFVDQAHRQAQVASRAAGVERQVEVRAWMGDMGMARGVLTVLKMLNDNDPRLDTLRYRLNLAPVVLITGQLEETERRFVVINGGDG